MLWDDVDGKIDAVDVTSSLAVDVICTSLVDVAGLNVVVVGSSVVVKAG